MAESGTPSILLDADLRKSVMTDKYDITMNDGSEVWVLLMPVAHDILGSGCCVTYTDIRWRYSAECQKRCQSIHVDGEQTVENMLNTMADMYRYVFIDAPPLNLASDGEKIGSLCDGAILVVRR